MGLYHFWFRTYSPSLGRWLGRDPIGLVEGVNLYGYAANAPLGWIDRFGLQKVVIIVGQDPVFGTDWLVDNIIDENPGAQIEVIDDASKQDVLDAIADDSIDGIIFIGHGSADSTKDEKKGDPTEPPVMVPEPGRLDHDISPQDVKNAKKGKNLKKFDCRACFQGTRGRLKKWQEAFGPKVEFKGKRGKNKPALDALWETPMFPDGESEASGADKNGCE